VGKEPVIGLAVGEKLVPVPGMVQVLCFAGLNSLSPSPFQVLGITKPELQGMIDQVRLQPRLSVCDGLLVHTSHAHGLCFGPSVLLGCVCR
jgi:hypothetical protein